MNAEGEFRQDEQDGQDLKHGSCAPMYEGGSMATAVQRGKKPRKDVEGGVKEWDKTTKDTKSTKGELAICDFGRGEGTAEGRGGEHFGFGG
ncbi:MAG: hypothetical protein Q8Q12_02750 [bacterium]|nr:hypothetical protein [bacterium]